MDSRAEAQHPHNEVHNSGSNPAENDKEAWCAFERAIGDVIESLITLDSGLRFLSVGDSEPYPDRPQEESPPQTVDEIVNDLVALAEEDGDWSAGAEGSS